MATRFLAQAPAGESAGACARAGITATPGGNGAASRMAMSNAGGMDWSSKARYRSLPSTQMSPAQGNRLARKVAAFPMRSSVPTVVRLPSSAPCQPTRRRLIGGICGRVRPPLIRGRRSSCSRHWFEANGRHVRPSGVLHANGAMVRLCSKRPRLSAHAEQRQLPGRSGQHHARARGQACGELFEGHPDQGDLGGLPGVDHDARR